MQITKMRHTQWQPLTLLAVMVLSSTVAGLCEIRFDGFVKVHSMRSSYLRSPMLLDAVRPKLGHHHQYHVVRSDLGVGLFVLVQAALGLFTFHLFGLYDNRRPGDVPKEEFRSIIEEFIGQEMKFEVVTEARWMWKLTTARSFEFNERVFISGDACHSWPPFGGLGGNTAYQDSTNLGWKLNACLRGWGGKEILRSYGMERREQVLRMAMCVLAMTPEPGRLKLMGKMITSALGWLVKTKWYYMNSGIHAANHYALAGVMMGLRYNYSQILVD